jgi:hypothetical protein
MRLIQSSKYSESESYCLPAMVSRSNTQVVSRKDFLPLVDRFPGNFEGDLLCSALEGDYVLRCRVCRIADINGDVSLRHLSIKP